MSKAVSFTYAELPEALAQKPQSFQDGRPPANVLMTSSPLFQRFFQSFGAYGFGQLVNVASQLALVPLFLRFWGADRYGEWLVLSALPSVIALSDVGFCSTGANSMAQHAARGDTSAVRVTLQTLNLFLFVVSAIVLTVVGVILYVMPVNEALNIKQYSEWETKLVIFALAANALLSIYSGLVAGIYRAGGRNARGVMAQNLMRLLTLGLTIIAIPMSQSIAVLAAATLLVQVVGTAVMILDSRNDLPGAPLGFRDFKTAELKANLRPALAFTAMPLGNAVYFQGLTLLANHFFGATGVVVYNSLRTFSRVIAQASQLVKHAAWPEFSLLLARDEKSAARWFHRVCFEANMVMSLAAALFAWAISGWLLPLWTHGAVTVSPLLAGAFLLSAFVSCIGMISLGVLQSSNAHERVSWQYLACYVMGWLVALATGASFGQYGLAAGMLFAELLILISSLWGASRYLAEDPRKFLLSAMSFSGIREMIQRRRLTT